MKILFVIILSLLSGVLYRLGGIGKPFNTKFRDCGCPLVALICLWLLKGFNLGFWWAYLLTFGLGWGVMTTYWKKKGTDAKWWNWLLTGAGYGLSALPLCWIGVHWYVLLYRTVVLSIGTMLWSDWQGNVVWEECGRGALITATIPLLSYFT